MFTVDQAVRGEMDDAVTTQFAACDKLAVGLEASDFERRNPGRKLRDKFSLVVGKYEAIEAVAMKAPN